MRKGFASMDNNSKDTFHISGPVHLTSNFDWENDYHRRAIIASLVKGVSVLERDRQNDRRSPEALPSPWWESFNFELQQPLVDDKNKSYFGAIYEYKDWSSDYNYPERPPRYVIAFRGTILKQQSMYRDLKLNLLTFCNKLHLSSRLQKGLLIAQKIIDEAGKENVWLAGYSLGSATALLIAMNIVQKGIHVKTYLFNLPYVSLPVEQIMKEILQLEQNIAEKLTDGIRIGKAIITTAVGVAAGYRPKSKHEDPFIKLSDWTPYLFVNPSDPICSEYIAYFRLLDKLKTTVAGETGKFQLRDKIKAFFADKIGELVIQNSIRSLATAGNDSDPMPRLPSAYLAINWSSSQNCRKPHSIGQWWKQYIDCSYKLHQFK